MHGAWSLTTCGQVTFGRLNSCCIDLGDEETENAEEEERVQIEDAQLGPSGPIRPKEVNNGASRWATVGVLISVSEMTCWS